MAWKPWQLETPYMSGPEVLVIKDKLWRKFQWVRDTFPQLRPEGRTDVYDEYVAAAVRQYRYNMHWDATGAAPADWQVKVGLGIVKASAAPVPVLPMFISVTGTGGHWDNGFGYDIGEILRKAKKVQHRPIGYNTSAFMMGDAGHSFLDALVDGSNEMMDWALPFHGDKILDGYSMGASVVTRFLNMWPLDRQNEIVMVLQQGDPTRPAGPTLLGNDPGGQGISNERPPAWVLNRYYSFAIDGDMYPAAVGVMPEMYQILSHMEATVDFMMYLFGMLATSAGTPTAAGASLLGLPGAAGSGLFGFGALAPLLGMLTPGPTSQTAGPINLMAMIFNLPGIIQALMGLMKFAKTGAHSHYGDQPVFGGMTGVDKAVQLVSARR